MGDCASGGWIAEHVALALTGAVALAQLPRAVSALSYLASERHSCGAAPTAPAGGFGARYFRSDVTGLWLYYRVWRPSQVGADKVTGKGFIYISHGYAEHCTRYTATAEALAGAGFTVVALDHQGHGQSEGDRGHIVTLASAVADVLQLVREVPPATNSPAFLFGHSMGGLIALLAAMRAPAGTWRGVVLSAPGLSFDPALDTPLNRFLARSLSNVLPKLPVAPLNHETLSTSPAVIAQYKRDPLIYSGKVRVRTGYEVMRGVEEALAAARGGDLGDTPLLIVHGEADVLVNISGSRALMALLAGSKDKTLVSFPGLKHELLAEPGPRGGAEVLRTMQDWLLAHSN